MNIRSRPCFAVVLRFTLIFMVAVFSSRSVVAADTSWVGNRYAAARLITATEAVGSNPRIDGGLQIRLERGWHSYWRNPGAAGIPPSIDWTGSRNVKSVKMYWPAPHRYLLYGLVTQGYEHGVVFPLSIILKRPGEPVVLHALVRYSACKTICIPYTAKLSLRLSAGLASPGPQAPLIARAWARVPSTLTEAGLSVSRMVVSRSPGANNAAILSIVIDAHGARLSHPDLFIQTPLPGSTPSAPEIWLDASHRHGVFEVAVKGVTANEIAGKALRFTLETGHSAAAFSATPVVGPIPTRPVRASLGLILVLALLGGLILNVMPCVLPVLSLKLMSVAGASGGARRELRMTLSVTALGIVTSYLALAAAVAALKLAGMAIGWGIQFQQAWFLGAMAAITTLFAASLWNWLPVPLPSFATRTATMSMTGHPRMGAFLIGALATLLATSCSAPFVGTAVGFALARNPATIFGIFAALGIGMALPYMLVAAFPGLVRWIPRPGRWMDFLRIGLGFALLGTSIWLVSIIGAVVSLGAATAAAALLLALLGLLYLRYRYGATVIRHPLSIAAIAVGALAILAPSLMPATLNRSVPDPQGSETVWRPLAPARIVSLVKHGKIVFVDVTAAWCLICKVNALTVLDRDPVARQLRAPGVVAMRGDWTLPNAQIAAYLRSFGRYGVPLDVVYGPGALAGIKLPSLLTQDVVLQAFRRAAGPSTGKEAGR